MRYMKQTDRTPDYKAKTGIFTTAFQNIVIWTPDPAVPGF